MSQALLRQYIADTGLTQAKIANKLGVSSAVVSQYLKGEYAGDTERIDKAVRELTERHAQKSDEIKTDFVMTTSAKNITLTCQRAHATADVYLVVGDAGLGKTCALKEYAHKNSNVIMLEIDPTYSVKVLLSELCNHLSISGAKGNQAMLDAIIAKLKGSERLLIIDEAEFLAYRCLEIVRRIHDKAEIGVVLAGMPRLIGNLRGARGEYKQLYSRVGFMLDLQDRLSECDIAMLCTHALGTDEFNQRLIKASNGNARRLNKILKGIYRIASKEGVAINSTHIDIFENMLIG